MAKTLLQKYNGCLGKLYTLTFRMYDHTAGLHKTQSLILMPTKVFKINGWWYFDCQTLTPEWPYEWKQHCKAFIQRAKLYKDEMISHPAAAGK